MISKIDLEIRVAQLELELAVAKQQVINYNQPQEEANAQQELASIKKRLTEPGTVV